MHVFCAFLVGGILMLDTILNASKHTLIFVKDKCSNYLYCNEAVAEAAGLDSPKQIIGKTDRDLFWRQQANLYIHGDHNVLQGKVQINVQEPQTQLTKIATILTTKTILTDKKGYITGVIGYGTDITGNSFSKNNGYICSQKNIFYLGEHFSNEYFTKRELEVFKYLLLGKSVEEISVTLYRSIKTIQTQIKHIANKLQCSHKSEIVPTAIKYGLTHVLNQMY